MATLGSDRDMLRFVKRSQSHPLPERRLLAAVVVQAVRDATSERVPPYYQETARLFLAGGEGQALLAAFGIPEQKARALIQQWLLR